MDYDLGSVLTKNESTSGSSIKYQLWNHKNLSGARQHNKANASSYNGIVYLYEILNIADS